MRALRFHHFGPPSVLEIEEVPTPTPASGELLVEVRAAAINPSDPKNVAGLFEQTTLPRTPGRDFSGVIISRSTDANRPVWGTGPGLGLTRDGAHAQYLCAPPQFVAPRPANLSFEQAAGIGVPFTTAWASIMDAGVLKADETILIIGARGTVGQAATQIANWKGARVLAGATESSPIPGADAVINTRTEDMRQCVFELTDGRGADVVFDVVGGPMFQPGVRSLRLGGRYVVIASSGIRQVTFDLVDFYHNRAHLIGVDSNKFRPAEVERIMNELNCGFDSGALKISNFETVPFDRAISAYERVTMPRTPKQILTF